MKVLAIQLKRIGDLILTTPALSALAASGARISLLVDSGCASLLPAIDGLDEKLVYHKRSFNRLLWRRLRAETPIATIFKHLQDAPPIDDAPLPEPLKAVLRKALAKNPDERYATAAEMVAALTEARRKSSSLAAPAPATRLRDLLAEAERHAAADRLPEAQALLREAVDVDPHSTVAFRRLFEIATALADREGRS